VTTIPGASKFLNASTLANLKGVAAQSTDLLSSLSGAVDLLSVGRNNRVSGIGLSNSSRALTRDLLNKSSSNANGLFSATVGNTSTVEGLQKQVLALRASKSSRQLAESLQPIGTDDGSVSSSSTGTTIDKTA
jgi:hypothetical protein